MTLTISGVLWLAPLLEPADLDFFWVTPALAADLLGHGGTLIEFVLEWNQLAHLVASHPRNQLTFLTGDLTNNLKMNHTTKKEAIDLYK